MEEPVAIVADLFGAATDEDPEEEANDEGNNTCRISEEVDC
jgi:hypothetical protein